MSANPPLDWLTPYPDSAYVIGELLHYLWLHYRHDPNGSPTYTSLMAMCVERDNWEVTLGDVVLTIKFYESYVTLERSVIDAYGETHDDPDKIAALPRYCDLVAAIEPWFTRNVDVLKHNIATYGMTL